MVKARKEQFDTTGGNAGDTIEIDSGDFIFAPNAASSLSETLANGNTSDGQDILVTSDGYIGIGDLLPASGGLRLEHNTGIWTKNTTGADRRIAILNTSNELVFGDGLNNIGVAAFGAIRLAAGTRLDVETSEIRFDAAETSPIITQENATSGNGQTLTVRSQQGGTDSDGGDLNLLSGSGNGTGNPGTVTVALPDLSAGFLASPIGTIVQHAAGNVTQIRNGLSDVIAEFASDHVDFQENFILTDGYVGIGDPNSLPASGGLRLEHNSGIWTKNAAGVDRRIALLNTSNELIFGDGLNNIAVAAFGTIRLAAATRLDVEVPEISFGSAETSPTITQEDTSSGNGQSLTIQAQSTTDTAEGGGLLLQSGDGPSDPGTIAIALGDSSGVINLTPAGGNVVFPAGTFWQIAEAPSTLIANFDSTNGLQVFGDGYFDSVISGSDGYLDLGFGDDVILNASTNNGSLRFQTENSDKLVIELEATASADAVKVHTSILEFVPEADIGSGDVFITQNPQSIAIDGVDWNITAQSGGTLGGAGGTLNLSAGAADGTAGGDIGGSANLRAGAGAGASGANGGNILLDAGDAGTNGVGGNINMFSGAGGSSSGNSGSINIETGTVSGTTDDAGDITLRAASGGTASGTDGSIILRLDTGGNVAGVVNFQENTSVFASLDPTNGLQVFGDGYFDGKLTVTGLIDPTGLILDEQNPGFGATNVSSGQGILWVDNSTSPTRLVFTSDSGGDSILSGSESVQTLSETLSSGNTADGYSIDAGTGLDLDFKTDIGNAFNISIGANVSASFTDVLGFPALLFDPAHDAGAAATASIIVNNAATDRNGMNLSVVAGDAGGTNRDGGDLILEPGEPTGSGLGGAVRLRDHNSIARITVNNFDVSIDGYQSVDIKVGGSDAALFESTALTLDLATIQWDSSVTSPTITQQDTTSGNGQSLTIQAQSTTDTAEGGGLLLQSGDGPSDPGTIAIALGDSSGVINLTPAGGNIVVPIGTFYQIAEAPSNVITTFFPDHVDFGDKFVLTDGYVGIGDPNSLPASGGLRLADSQITFGSFVTSPTITQETLSSGTGETLTINAQDVTTGTGGDITMRSGSGSSADGEVSVTKGTTDNVISTTADGYVDVGDVTDFGALEVYDDHLAINTQMSGTPALIPVNGGELWVDIATGSLKYKSPISGVITTIADGYADGYDGDFAVVGDGTHLDHIGLRNSIATDDDTQRVLLQIDLTGIITTDALLTIRGFAHGHENSGNVDFYEERVTTGNFDTSAGLGVKASNASFTHDPDTSGYSFSIEASGDVLQMLVIGDPSDTVVWNGRLYIDITQMDIPPGG